MHIKNAFKQPWPAVALWVIFGGWLTVATLDNYLERGHSAYLIVAGGYGLFTLLMALCVFITAPANEGRFTRKQLLIARVAPLAALGVSAVGLWLRWA